MCTQFQHNIHSSTSFPYKLPPTTGANLQGRTFLFSVFAKKKIDIFKELGRNKNFFIQTKSQRIIIMRRSALQQLLEVFS
jgi:hypothetical protein